jgi:hypothetical protein
MSNNTNIFNPDFPAPRDFALPYNKTPTKRKLVTQDDLDALSAVKVGRFRDDTLVGNFTVTQNLNTDSLTTNTLTTNQMTLTTVNLNSTGTSSLTNYQLNNVTKAQVGYSTTSGATIKNGNGDIILWQGPSPTTNSKALLSANNTLDTGDGKAYFASNVECGSSNNLANNSIIGSLTFYGIGAKLGEVVANINSNGDISGTSITTSSIITTSGATIQGGAIVQGGDLNVSDNLSVVGDLSLTGQVTSSLRIANTIVYQNPTVFTGLIHTTSSKTYYQRLDTHNVNWGGITSNVNINIRVAQLDANVTITVPQFSINSSNFGSGITATALRIPWQWVSELMGSPYEYIILTNDYIAVTFATDGGGGISIQMAKVVITCGWLMIYSDLGGNAWPPARTHTIPSFSVSFLLKPYPPADD